MPSEGSELYYWQLIRSDRHDTSASIGQAKSEIFRTAASPLPTAKSAMISGSYISGVAVVVATNLDHEDSPTILYPRVPHQRAAMRMTYINVLSTHRLASISRRCVSEMILWFWLCQTAPGAKSTRGAVIAHRVCVSDLPC